MANRGHGEAPRHREETCACSTGQTGAQVRHAKGFISLQGRNNWLGVGREFTDLKFPKTTTGSVAVVTSFLGREVLESVWIPKNSQLVLDHS